MQGGKTRFIQRYSGLATCKDDIVSKEQTDGSGIYIRQLKIKR